MSSFSREWATRAELELRGRARGGGTEGALRAAPRGNRTWGRVTNGRTTRRGEEIFGTTSRRSRRGSCDGRFACWRERWWWRRIEEKRGGAGRRRRRGGGGGLRLHRDAHETRDQRIKLGLVMSTRADVFRWNTWRNCRDYRTRCRRRCPRSRAPPESSASPRFL